MASTNASTRARASRATSRGTVRDSARQCGTVFEDGKGRSSSRRAGKKMRGKCVGIQWSTFYCSFYCGFESPRVVTVAALKLTVSFLHNVTMTSILGRVRGFRPTRASILRSARALSR